MLLADRIETMHRVCFDATPREQDLESLGDPERWMVYRRMVRKRLTDVIEAALPRTSAILGDVFDTSVQAWLAKGGPRIRMFRNVPDGFFDWANSAWKQDHPVAHELARYEITCWSVKHGPPVEVHAEAFAFDRPPLMNPGMHLLRLNHPVHEDPIPSTGNVESGVQLCIYRDATHRAVTWTLNPLAADLIDAWLPGDRTVAETVQTVAAAHGAEIGPAFVEKLSAMIADFIERGVLLGSQPAA